RRLALLLTQQPGDPIVDGGDLSDSGLVQRLKRGGDAETFAGISAGASERLELRAQRIRRKQRRLQILVQHLLLDQVPQPGPRLLTRCAASTSSNQLLQRAEAGSVTCMIEHFLERSAPLDGDEAHPGTAPGGVPSVEPKLVGASVGS